MDIKQVLALQKWPEMVNYTVSAQFNGPKVD